MKRIIITKDIELLDEQAVDGLEKEYDYPENGVAEVTEGVIFATVEEVKVGYSMILVKEQGADEFKAIEYRRNVQGMAIDGEAIPVHGENFKRINCITTQAELDTQVSRIKTRLDLDTADLNRRIAKLNADAQAKINRLNAEYADYQNSQITADNTDIDTDAADDTEEETAE